MHPRFFSKNHSPSPLPSMGRLPTVKDYQQLAIKLNKLSPELKLSFSVIFPEEETRFAVSYCFDQNPPHIVIALASQGNQRRDAVMLTASQLDAEFSTDKSTLPLNSNVELRIEEELQLHINNYLTAKLICHLSSPLEKILPDYQFR